MNTLFQRLRNNPCRTGGALMFLTGAVFFMGVITAEIFYPPGYSTAHNEISDLGATRPPDSLIFQPSATIFDTTMMVCGLMMIAAAYFIHRAFRRAFVTGAILFLGIGMLGVGIFPGNNPVFHPIFALIAFVAAGTSALVSSRVTRPPFRYMAVLLGGITFSFILLGFFLAGVVFPILGDGGTERWIAYPAMLWLLGFGGYLSASTEAVRSNTQ